MDNPIKYSEFIQPDQSVSNLIAQLELLQTKYTELEAKIRGDAAKIATSLKNMSSATEAGRESTRKAATEAEKLAKANNDLENSQKGVAKEIAALKVQQQQQNNINKLTAKLNAATEGSYNKLSAQYSLNKIRLNALSKAERESTASGKKLETQTREIYEEMNRLQKATGKHQLQVGQYGIATENLHPILGRLNGSLASMGTNLQALSNADKPFKVLTTAVLNFGKATLAFVLTPVGLLLSALGAVFYLISSNKDTVLEFNSGLIDVGKTANLTGEDLRDLGQDIVDLSRKLKVVGAPALLEYAKVAGQLGVTGRENILLFTEALAKLETASDIAGADGAAAITRLLTLTDGGVQNVAEFGDEIVNLGNNFAATEQEILTNATAIAQNTAQYGVGRKTVLAYATATKAVGLEAEITGSTIGRTLGLMEKSIRTGEGIDTIAKLTGQNVEALKAQFKEDPGAVFSNFVAGLNSVNEAGGSVNEQLENIGITSIRDQRVISSLATAGFDVLKGSIDEVNNSAGELDKEFGAASQKLASQLNRVSIAWDNLILTMEDGEGFLSKTAAFFSSEFADALDRASLAIKLTGAFFSGLGGVIDETATIFREFITSLGSLGDIKFDLNDPIGTLNSFKNALGDIKNVNPFKDVARLGSAFSKSFTEEIIRIDEATEDGMASVSSTIEAELDKAVTKSIKSVGEIDDAIAKLSESLKGASSRGEAQAIQSEIAALEAKRNAILGVANANIKELESRATAAKKAEISVMESGESKDIANLEIELEAKKALWQKYGLDVALLDEYEKRQRAEISKKYKDQQDAADEKAAADAKAKRDKEFKSIVDLSNQEYDLELSRIDLMKTTEAEKTKLRLEAERDRIQKILDLNKSAETKLSKLQVDTMQNTIDKINQEINSAASGGDLYSKLGISLNDEQKQAIADSAAYAKEIVSTVLAAKLEAADAALEKAEEETSAAETNVEREIEARNNGYANDVIGAQRDLELAKKTEAKALKEKQKAQKAQEAIDTAMQISSLITATAEIWKSNAGIPIIGSNLAIAATALMWGSFAASKITAATAAKEKYGDGGLEFLDGGSHASGNDIPIGMTSRGKQRTAEGGEAMAIINKRQTRKYKSALPNIIKSLNNGTFEKAYSNSFVDDNNKLIFAESNSDFSKMESSLEAIRQNGEKRTYIDGNGRLVEIYKNVKRIYV